MKIPYFKKVIDSEGNEWVDSQDIFQYVNEYDAFFNKWYQFIVKKCEQLNYYNKYTSTAYGNPDLSWLIGFCSGWLSAKNCYEDIKDGVCYIKDQRDRVIIKFDVPKISQMERENRKELNNILDEIFG